MSSLKHSSKTTSCLVCTKKGKQDPRGRPKQKKGTVSWNDDNLTIHDAPSCPSEITGVWYNLADLEDIQAHISAQVKLMKAKQPEDQDHCYRGLEYKTKKRARRRKAAKSRAYQAALAEQERQTSHIEEYDPKLLAEVYKGYTGSCCNKAYRVGLQDSEIAATILKDVVTDSKMLRLPLEILENRCCENDRETNTRPRESYQRDEAPACSWQRS